MKLTIMPSVGQNNNETSMCFREQQSNHFGQGGPSPSNNSFQSGGDGFHSPIVVGKESGCIQIEADRLPLIPQIPPECSMELENHSAHLDRLERDLQLALKSIDRAERDRKRCEEKNNAQTPTPEANRNPSHTPVVESFPTRDVSLAQDETTDVIPIDGFGSDCKYNDLELMKEALSVLVGYREEIASGDSTNGYGGDSQQLATQNIWSRNDQESNPSFPVQTRGDIKITTEHYPDVLPQVTFDEEDELDRHVFFEERLEDESQTKVEPKPLTPTSRTFQEPSLWLLHQLDSDAASFPEPLRKKSGDDRDEVDSHCHRASKGTKHKHWTEGEDETLRLAMESEQQGKPTNWVRIARTYFSNSRSATQCKNRWKNHLQPGVIRGNWQKGEDEFITNMRSQGFKWLDIAKGLPGRTSEHVRERYVNVLDDNLKKTGWTEEEDKILFESQRRLGNKWSEIRRLLPGRSDNMIKNRYYNKRNAYLRRLKRDATKKQHVSLV